MRGRRSSYIGGPVASHFAKISYNFAYSIAGAPSSGTVIYCGKLSGFKYNEVMHTLEYEIHFFLVFFFFSVEKIR